MTTAVDSTNRYLVDIYPNELQQDIFKAKVLIICYTITTEDRMWHDPIQDQQTLLVILEAHNFDPYAEKHCSHTVDLEALDSKEDFFGRLLKN